MDHAQRLDRIALVVDDDVFMVSALAELLEEDGFEVHTASNGFSGLRQVLEVRPGVVLLDVALPERSGGELLNDLRAEPTTRDIAIVLVTGHAADLNEHQLAEADGVISKPFDDTELLEAVHHALQRAAIRRAEVAPVTTAHHEVEARSRRAAGSVRRTRGRR